MRLHVKFSVLFVYLLLFFSALGTLVLVLGAVVPGQLFVHHLVKRPFF